jgi:hypothetical protein
MFFSYCCLSSLKNLRSSSVSSQDSNYVNYTFKHNSGSLPLTTTSRLPSACLTDLWAAHSAGSTWMNLVPIDARECLRQGVLLQIGKQPLNPVAPDIREYAYFYFQADTLCRMFKLIEIPMLYCRASDRAFSTRPAGASEYPWYTRRSANGPHLRLSITVIHGPLMARLHRRQAV